jgi:alpha-L-fucosidase
MSSADTTWFTEARFGLFIHWGLYAIPARHEWIMKREEIAPEDYRERYLNSFNPDKFDPGDWARRARAAGMRYVVITAKHHEGFCLWDSGHTDYKATNTPFGRDALREIIDAFRAEGLRVGLYYSLLDWHHPQFTIDLHHPLRNHPDAVAMNDARDMSVYRQYMRYQVTELLTGFGPIDIIWFDFSYPHLSDQRFAGKGRADWGSEELVELVRGLAPQIIINNRLDLVELEPDIVTPEQFMPRTWPTVDGRRAVWEACHTLSGSWGYHRDESSWKSPEQLVTLLADTVSKGGNLLMNVGPNARGALDERARSSLSVYQAWMAAHAASIHGATSAELPVSQDVRLTRHGDRIYVHVLAWPFRHLHIEGLGGKVARARLMTDGSELKILVPQPPNPNDTMQVPVDPDILTLELPVARPNPIVPVIELALHGSREVVN